MNIEMLSPTYEHVHEMNESQEDFGYESNGFGFLLLG